MRAASVFMRCGVVASFAMLSACLSGLQEFGSNSCRTVYVISGGIIQPMNTCGGVPREGLRTGLAASGADLPALLAAPKFEPDAYYTGVDMAADKAPLTKIVNDALRDLIALPVPRDPSLARQRLLLAVLAVDKFATEDREQAHIYLVLAWRTAGFLSESGLAPVSDQDVLTVP